MPIYPTEVFAALASSHDLCGLNVKREIKANGAAIASLNSGGTPSPIPQKAPESGATPEQIKCSDVAYLLYQLALLEPCVDPQQAKMDYCANHEACFAV